MRQENECSQFIPEATKLVHRVVVGMKEVLCCPAFPAPSNKAVNRNEYGL